jgi:aryl-alcohol dehydrogenase-like predicted oxidoreductase
VEEIEVQTKQLGNSDLEITRLGIGSWAIGGPGYAFAWGPQDDNESIAAIRAAIDAGLNWIDTAAVYGLGHSEEIVARALDGVHNRPYVFTKCERAWNERREIRGSLKGDSIRKECEGSLRRLRVDVIDLYQIHWPEPDQDIEEGWTEMARLKDEGKVRNIGVSNFNADQMRRAWAIAPITSLQPPYSLLDRGIEERNLPFCRQHGIGVIAYSPMKSGLLSGAMTRERIAALPKDDWRSRHPDFQEPKLSRNLQLVELLRGIGNPHGLTAGEVAIAWTLGNPAVTAAIVGLRQPDQVSGIIGAADFRLSEAGQAEIQRFLGTATGVGSV